MNTILLFLLSLLPKAEGEDIDIVDIDAEGDEGQDEDGEGSEDGEDDSDLDADDGMGDLDPKPEKKPSRREQEVIKLRERAQAAERELEEVRRQASQGSQQQGTPAPSPDQQLWDDEEKLLKDPAIEPWQRYAIQSARDARAAKNESRAAIFESRDIADKAGFELLATTKPKVFEKYAPEVEKMLTAMRKNGNNAPRKELLALLVGRDLIDGKLKPAESKKKASGAERLKPPGARSDISSRGSRLSDAEKVAKRLEGVRI